MVSLLGAIGNVMWVTSLAAVLAGISTAYYQSRITEPSLWELLKTRSYQLLLAASGIGFSLGMSLRSDGWVWVLFWVLIIGVLGVWIYFLRAERESI